MSVLRQDPEPGRHLVRHAGDLLRIEFVVPGGLAGRAWLRTNLGGAATRRADIIDHVRSGDPILHHDWTDLPMQPQSDGRYSLTLPLVEIGRFEAKCFFLPPGSEDPIWPEGANTTIKVEPADTIGANLMYTAFVRQFGPDRGGSTGSGEREAAVHVLDAAGYTVIPRGGTFRDLGRELDFILGTLGFRILQLLPIHPVPTTYARMGRFGSPFAALDYLDVDPALAEFDRRTTPLQQFGELLDAVHARGAKLFMDMPINHTGWASHLQTHHPEWFARNDDATFTSPGAWGVTWEDLSKLDYRDRGLWQHMATVFLYWCRQGVDGFRCDAGYMVPPPVWEYLVAEVRAQFPDTVFLLEGLGGPMAVVDTLLHDSNLDWAYSELFQIHDRVGIEQHVAACAQLAATRGLQVHYAETHDNDRLAARSRTWAGMRTALAALTSEAGGFGITNGVEWFATERVQVHGAAPLAWGRAENQVDRVRRLVALLKRHPAFRAGAVSTVVAGGHPAVFSLRRACADGSEPVLVLVNLDEHAPATAVWQAAAFPGGGDVSDLVGHRVVRVDAADDRRVLVLGPGEAVCLAADPAWLTRLDAPPSRPGDGQESGHGARQRQRAKILELHQGWHGGGDVSTLPLEELCDQLTTDPEAAVAAVAGRSPAPLTHWSWPTDVRRLVMWPPTHALLVTAPAPFRLDLRDGDRVIYRDRSFTTHGGGHALLVPPRAEPAEAQPLQVDITVFAASAVQRDQATVLLLPGGDRAHVRYRFPAADALRIGAYAVLTNDIAALAQVRAAWGTVRSQYDALLAANLHPEHPTDRRVLFTRCRAWLVHRGYSHPLDERCLESFEAMPGAPACWRFAVPSGLGRRVPLELSLTLAADRNAVTLRVRRLPATAADHLADALNVRLIMRPDIEDRGMHEKTKAYSGPEANWPRAVTAAPHGFVFTPAAGRSLELTCSGGRFSADAEWSYMVAHPEEQERGLDGHSDLFSPGYFTCPLRLGASVVLDAEVRTGREHTDATPAPAARHRRVHRETAALGEALREAMLAYVVRRGAGRTVIAGYPWFLDWGRDTMICLRGMIAAGHLAEVKSILGEFARFEAQGTLPNLIHGADASNRDTSDAPLWFFTACADVCAAEGGAGFLRTEVGGRRLDTVLESIASAYMSGTPNGIRMDAESGLIFSPSHFTWMDTNFPAGTPREGYPVEIQALWHAALSLLAAHHPRGHWRGRADQVAASVLALYPVTRDGVRYLSDCLHARAGVPAARAVADDACRPNQLLALTLGLVTDPQLAADVIRACEALLVPGGIRSLADQPVHPPLPVVRDGVLLNEPVRPYWGRYTGDEDTRRKPAYHNGTAWTWLFPSYAEAWYRTAGEPVREAARALLGSAVWGINRDAVAQVPEILDGDVPHRGRGCGAQAWGVTELYRVLALLEE